MHQYMLLRFFLFFFLLLGRSSHFRVFYHNFYLLFHHKDLWWNLWVLRLVDCYLNGIVCRIHANCLRSCLLCSSCSLHDLLCRLHSLSQDLHLRYLNLPSFLYPLSHQSFHIGIKYRGMLFLIELSLWHPFCLFPEIQSSFRHPRDVWAVYSAVPMRDYVVLELFLRALPLHFINLLLLLCNQDSHKSWFLASLRCIKFWFLALYFFSVYSIKVSTQVAVLCFFLKEIL